MIELRRATDSDRRALIAMLAEAGFGYDDPPEDYTLAVDGDTIVGCGRLEDEGDIMMLRPLVVARQRRRQGIGGILLKGIIPDDKPVALVAQGYAVPFYRSLGFEATGWDSVSVVQREECDFCFNRASCQPLPMIHIPQRGAP